MTREDIKRINSEYLDDAESTFEMEEVFELANKAIEQESVLDKIRAETYQKLGTHGNVSLYNRAIYDVLQIIDKYRTESEEV